MKHFQADFGLSGRRVCELAGQNRPVQRSRSRTEEVPGLEMALVEQAEERSRFGHERLTTMLRSEGFLVNHKRLNRIYSRLGLAVRRKRRKRASQAPRIARPTSEAVNDCSSMDFVSVSVDGIRTMRVFAAADDHSRRCVALEFEIALPAERVARILDRAIETHGKPMAIRTDNGPEFTSRAFDAWAYRDGIEQHFIRPGKLIEYVFAESFNGRRRDEILDQHCFEHLRHTGDLCGDGRDGDGDVQPYTALGGRSPER
ncbi:MAG: DDE-type integrase/transposase/recombinase [Planctomycetota bacterium]